MGQVVTIGVDLAKSVFQAHGVDEAGEVVVRRKLRRSQLVAFFARQPTCLVGIEACASSHHWARALIALGHQVKLMPAQYVKPYVKRSKNDAADAEAICEAVTRPTMRFVAIKSPEQQCAMMLHRVRLVLCRQRTQLANALRAHLAEFGIVAPVGRLGLQRLIEVVADPEDHRLPAGARISLQMLVAQLAVVKAQILKNDRQILADARRTELGRRLMAIPGVGPLIASALVAHRRRSAHLPVRARPGGLDRPGPTSELQRRQGAPRLHLQGGSPVSAPDARRRVHGGDPARRAIGQAAPMAGAAPGAQEGEGRRGGARQQDRADLLGDDGHRRALPRAGGRLSAARGRLRVGKGEKELMHKAG